ncbi:ABC transporter substrate-binding protein [Allonocardiopsis opalescens]|uniref:Peptide/nickel transport system substrate-binding protein n=1 Tax=Allonocardiopsis opalescens TaxID=1144618 RepID=A0A2T0Q442_9ACTN|nr:ABC transporter substrate-binding protein [Allonocardiopsis opalescens]PRX98574.1 peptide/nickel transport system substrate-binding protein [Allonocardiopsis opalescens]
MRKRWLSVAALAAAGSMALASCGGGGGGGGGGAEVEFNQGLTEVVNPSEEPGGTLRFAMSSDIESTDPGNTYYGYNWNFTRFYARTVMAYTSEPGTASTQLQPDLAAAPPEVSEDGLTWTVELQQGLRYENGEEIVAEDIKYAIARSNYGEARLPNGPTYFAQLLADSEDYEGPYAEGAEDDPLAGFDGIETPDDYTLVFHLNEPFSDFPYLMMIPQTAPVPAEEDTGEQYQANVVSSGPYMFEDSYQPGEQFNMIRNPEWDPTTDPVRSALPDRIEFTPNIDQNDIDQQLMNGDVDIDLGGTGLGPAQKGTALNDERQRPFLDNGETGALRYVAVNTVVEPLDNVACRRAVQYAANHDALQRAWGGETGGAIPTQIIPPAIPGHDPSINPYPAGEDNTGDLEAAQAQLEECGQPDGFEMGLGVRSDRPADVATAEALQESLARVGIETEIMGYPADTYTNTQAGSPDFVHENNMGLMVYGWIPDWPTGYGFMSSIVDGDAIVPAGNSNLPELDDPEINALFDEVATVTDPEEQAAIYTQIDQLVMDSAAILPVVFERSVLYRPERLTNVYFHSGYAMYDYMSIGIDPDAQE